MYLTLNLEHSKISKVILYKKRYNKQKYCSYDDDYTKQPSTNINNSNM